MPGKRVVSTLSPKDVAAINAHMRGLSRSAALKKANFLPSMCTSHGNHFWGREDVQKELQRRMKDIARKADVDATRLIKMLMEIAELDVAKLVDTEGNLKPLPDIQDSIRKTLMLGSSPKGLKIKNANRLKAIELIAKLLGLMDDKVQVSVDADLRAALMAGRQRAALRNKPEGESDNNE